MELIMFAIAFMGFCIGASALYEIRKLEHRIRALENPVDTVALIHLLKENIGKTVKLNFFEYPLFENQKVIVLDLDDDWILLESTKKQKVLVQIKNIKNVTIL
ncbi:MAG: hypothetical protein K2N64_05720 [Anaeroplasmataceae bacterium]|nr:hypothetical protein [Anaeroplasmataceae bacterium]